MLAPFVDRARLNRIFGADMLGRAELLPLLERLVGIGDVKPFECVGTVAEVQAAVRAEKVGEVAAEFDRIHSIQRAVQVGSVDEIISVAQLRPRIIGAIERGLRR
jgi:hypothetical protein